MRVHFRVSHSSRPALCAAAICSLIGPGFGNIALAQKIEFPQNQPALTPAPPAAQTSKSKATISLDELNGLDAKYHRDLDVAQAESDGAKFVDAQTHFAQLAAAIEATNQRIASSVLPKGSIQIDGQTRPVSAQTETELFTRILDKAQRGEKQAAVLAKVAEIQTQASDFLTSHQYMESRDAWQKAKQALAAERQQIDDATYLYFLAKCENGVKVSITSYWSAEYARLRDKYNRTTDEGKMSPDEVYRTIKSVADEITAQAYTEAGKHPDMPEDARALFTSLLATANQYLASR